MINKIINLIPSNILKEAIKNQNWIFNELEQINIVYELAETQNQRLEYLNELKESLIEPSSKKLASDLLDLEELKYNFFIKDSNDYFYDIIVYETPRTIEQRYSCKSYAEVINFLSLYVELHKNDDIWKEHDKIKYEVQKRKFVKYNKLNDLENGPDEIGYFEFIKGGILKKINIWSELNEKCNGSCSECKKKCADRRLDNLVIKFPKVFKKYDIVSCDDYYCNNYYSEREYFLLLGSNTAKDILTYLIPLDISIFADLPIEEYFNCHKHEEVYRLEKASINDLEPKQKELYNALVKHVKKVYKEYNNKKEKK